MIHYLVFSKRIALSVSILCAASLLAGCSSTETPTTELSEVASSSIVIESRQVRFARGVHADQLVCEDCHAEDNEAESDLSSRVSDTAMGPGNKLSSSSLCLECHADIRTAFPNSASGEIAHQESGCSECHDVHSGQASCIQSGCHATVKNTLYANVEVPAGHATTGNENAFMCGGSQCHVLANQVAAAPIYHQPVHKAIACYTCHDAAGMDVVLDDKGQWITSLSDQEDDTFVSHSLQTKVACSRCHDEY